LEAAKEIWSMNTSQPTFRRYGALATAVVLCGLPALYADDATPRDAAVITKRIDVEIQKQLDEVKVKPSALTDDAEFLRRVYLDIVGRIPPTDKAVAFLDSTDPHKRAKLVDELLASPDYGRNFATVWKTMLVKRDEANRALDTKAFTDWLAKQFNENNTWDEVVYDILTAEGPTDKTPQGMFFLANREMARIDPAKVTGATTNLFMGVQMQCAQCHNHPFSRQWKHTDFWGMAAFFGRVRDDSPTGKGNRPAKTGNLTEVASTAKATGRPGAAAAPKAASEGKIAIPSPTEVGKTVGVAQARFFEGDEVKLDDKTPYRPVFAEWLTSPSNKYFAKAAVNRWWAHFMVRGLVNPIEDMHEENEPSHPELLKFLAEDFSADFDLKRLIRGICNSQVYQRSSRPTEENKEHAELYSHHSIKVMSTEVMYDAMTQALGGEPGTAPAAGGGPGAGRGPALSARDSFVRFFDTKDEGDDATESGHGIPQFLRLMNSAPFNRATPLIETLVKDCVSRDKALETMFLTTLARRPTPAEVAKVSAFLEKQGDAKKGYSGVMWVLLNSAEFICVR
jgi:hypothetical protein